MSIRLPYESPNPRGPSFVLHWIFAAFSVVLLIFGSWVMVCCRPDPTNENLPAIIALPFWLGMVGGAYLLGAFFAIPVATRSHGRKSLLWIGSVLIVLHLSGLIYFVRTVLR